MAGKQVSASKPSNNPTGFSHLSFPTTHNAHSILFVFKDYDYKKLSEGVKLSNALGGFAGNEARSAGAIVKEAANITSIQLPFPKQLSDNTSLRINGFERSAFTAMAGDIAADFAKTFEGKEVKDIPKMLQGMGADLATKVAAASTNSISSLIDKAGGTSLENLTAAARYLMQQLPGDVGRTADAIAGTTINPKETLAFEGVNLKAHQFTWNLYPDNQADSERIRTIIKRIKKHILPGTDELLGFKKVFLKYPSMVDIYLLGVDKEHFMKFKTCMVTDFSVDYGPAGGVSIMKGGKPAGVTLSMTLQEVEIHTSDDYAENTRSVAVSTTQSPQE